MNLTGICGSGVLGNLLSRRHQSRTRISTLFPANDSLSQFELAIVRDLYAVSALAAKRGCLLTRAIREEQSSYRENLVASAQCGKVKRRGTGGC
jgi:hypothetical protein